MQKDTFEVEEDSKDGVDSQNEKEIPQGVRAIAPDRTYFIFYRN